MTSFGLRAQPALASRWRLRRSRCPMAKASTHGLRRFCDFAVSLAYCEGNRYTYAAPVPEFLANAPTTALEPETATAYPNSSPPVPSEASSSVCCVQVVSERVNT